MIPITKVNLINPGSYANTRELIPTYGFTTTKSEIISGLDIIVDRLNPLRIMHKIFFHHCRITWKDGAAILFWPGSQGSRLFAVDLVHVSRPNDLTGFPMPPDFETIEDMLVSHQPPPFGVGGFSYPPEVAPPIPDTAMQVGIGIFDMEDADIELTAFRISDPSVGLLIQKSSGVKASRFEVHRPRGPFYRGQGFQLVESHHNLIEDFVIKAPMNDSFPEDSVSLYYSNHNHIRRGLIEGNNSILGVGVMAETASFNLFEDIDCVDMGNGAFSSYGYWELSTVPPPPTGVGHNNTYRRCRARDSHWASPRGNRPASGVMFHSVGGTYGSRFEECVWWNPHPNAVPSEGEPTATMPIPGVLVMEPGSVDVMDFRQEDFTPHAWNPIQFPWEDWNEGPFYNVLNIDVGQGTPVVAETIADNTIVGRLRAGSAEPTETFSFAFNDGADFIITGGNVVRSDAPRFNWDEKAIEYLPIRATGSRGQHFDRNLPVIIDPIDPVGVGTLAGAVVGLVPSVGKLPNGWEFTASAGVTLEILEIGYTHPLHYLKIKVRAPASPTGIRNLTLHMVDGFAKTGPTAQGDDWQVRAYMSKEEEEDLVLNAGAILVYEADPALGPIGQHDILNEGLWFPSPDVIPPKRHPLLHPLAKFSEIIKMGEAGTERVSIAAYFELEITPTSGALEQTVYIAAPRLWPISGPNLLIEGSRFNGKRAGATLGVLGSGGSLPTGWTSTLAPNLTAEVVEIGTQNGIEYFDLLLTASPAAGDSNISIFFPGGWGADAAAVGEVWRVEAVYKLVSQSAPGVFSDNMLSIYELDNAWGVINNFIRQFQVPYGNTDLRTGYRYLEVEMPGPGTTYINGSLYFALNKGGSPVTARVRIAANFVKIS